MNTVPIGIIGGSGLYQMPELDLYEERHVHTTFGDPSDNVHIGTLAGVPVAFLPRHGKGHRIPPHQINYRANIAALKQLGVEWVLSVSAVGSLRQEVQPGEIVLVDQFIDRTRRRPDTFFENGVVAHVSFADPVCPTLHEIAAGVARDMQIAFHPRGTYVCIEGPMFSSRAESEVHRQTGASVIGMTNVQEARLCREAEMSYATIALVTDYDCWKRDEKPVEMEQIIATMRANVATAQRLLARIVPTIPRDRCSPYAGSLRHALVTQPEYISLEARRRLEFLIHG